MRRHGPVIAHCTDSEDFPKFRYLGLDYTEFLSQNVKALLLSSDGLKKYLVLSTCHPLELVYNVRP